MIPVGSRLRAYDPQAAYYIIYMLRIFTTLTNAGKQIPLCLPVQRRSGVLL